MSNVERLHQAGIINPDALSQHQKDFLNQELTSEDVDALIQVGQKALGYCKLHPPSFPVGFTPVV